MNLLRILLILFITCVTLAAQEREDKPKAFQKRLDALLNKARIFTLPKPKLYDNMPIFKPDPSKKFTMPSFTPDSSIVYKMQYYQPDFYRKELFNNNLLKGKKAK